MNPLPKSGNKQSLGWLFKRARSALPWIILSVGLGFSSGLLLVVQAALMANIIQAVFIDALPLAILGPRFYALALVIALRALLAWGREVAGFKAGANVRAHLRHTLMRHIIALGPAFTERQSTGALSSTLLEQVEGLHDFFAHYLPQLALAVMIPAAIAAFVFPLSWAAGALLVLAAPLIPLFMILVGMGAESIAQRNFQALARLSAHFLDVLQGLPTLKIYDRSRAEAERVAQTSADYRRQTLRVLRVAFLSSAVLEFFSSMAIALVAVYLGMRYLGYLDFGDYGRPLGLAGGFFILLLAPDFFLPLRELGMHYHARAAAVGAANEILKVLSTPIAQTPPADPQRPEFASFQIAFDRVCFAYDKGRRPVLDALSFRLQQGEIMALVGASGAGKTTLLNLIMGFIQPDQGSIHIGGMRLSEIHPEAWRRHLAWIGQNPVLFHGTIRENILIGNPKATPDALEAAARAARVIDFCRQLPDGLDTAVGEQGFGLSRGQAQRVALARAFLKKAPVLLLDEPTAGLDSENESLVMQALRKLTINRTVLMATHRLENIERADRILVLSSGSVAEQGRFDDLMRAGGFFYRLVKRGLTEVDP